MAYKKKRYRKKSFFGYEVIFIPVLFLIVYTQIGPKNGLLQEDNLKSNLPLIIGAAVLLIAIYAVMKMIPVWRRRHKYRTSRMFDIDRMKGNEFEAFLSVYFRDMGYKVLPHRGGAGDKGADILLQATDGRKYVVQAKRYSGKVPFEAIQQVHTARSLYGADEAIVISNTFYTKQSKTTAEKLNIELWDRNKLMENMYVYRKNKGA